MNIPTKGVFISFTFMCSVVAYVKRRLLTTITAITKTRDATAIVRTF